VHNAEGQPYQETRPPTALTIRAARAIVALANQTQQSNEIILNFQRQLNELTEQYEQLLQKANPTPEASD
jgi:prefoldin subunit 5